MLKYPVVLTRDTNDTYLVDFPDVPEAHTVGDDIQEALMRAVDALESALMVYIEKHRSIPTPSRPKKGGHSVTVPTLSEAKVAVHQAMLQARVRKSDLAQKLHWPIYEVDKLLDLNRPTPLDRIEAALSVLKKRLVLAVEDAA